MIVGKYLKNTALYSPDELERLDILKNTLENPQQWFMSF